MDVENSKKAKFRNLINGNSMVSLVQKYLIINNFADQKDVFEDLFLLHPDYPALFAITDTLDLLSIENVAIKVSKEELFELPDSFLTLHNQNLALVTKKKTFIKVESEKEGTKKLSFNDFVADWNGIVIGIEPNETSINKNLKTSLNWLYYSLPIFALVTISIFNNSYNINQIILLLTSIVGLVFSIFIVQEEIGIKNEMVAKFCNMSPDTSCNSVISSDNGKINKWISFSDLSILFFCINLTSLLLNPVNSGNIVGLLSLISLPLIAYSIWIQKVQLKKWCLLCLTISFLIILQSFVWIVAKEYFVYVSASGLFSYLFSTILIGSFWFLLSRTLLDKIKAEKEVSKLKKFKRNYKILNYLSKEVAATEGLNKLVGLKFGNHNADVRLTIILSPNCKHCHNTFTEALELVTTYPKKVFLNILFNINPENNDNPYKEIVECLLEINNTNEALAAEAITDWHEKRMGLEEWKEKWKVDFISTKVKDQIERQHNWCSENDFNYTPVKMVNDRLFPTEYDINELKYFLNNYTEEKEAFEKNNLVEL